MFVTDSLWKYVHYRFSVEISFVVNFLWKYFRYRLSVEVCLLQIICGGMFAIDFL